MSSNQILRSKLVGKIVKGGTEVVIAAATETQGGDVGCSRDVGCSAGRPSGSAVLGLVQ